MPVPKDTFSFGSGGSQLDLVGPLPPLQDYTYILTVIDRTTRWRGAFPVIDTFVASCANAFCAGWISCLDISAKLMLYRGAQFTPHLWLACADTLGIKIHLTLVYHPQASDIVKRLLRPLKLALHT